MVGTSALAPTSPGIAVDNRCSLTTRDPPVNQFTPISFSSATRWKDPCEQAPSPFSYTPHSPEHTAGLINPHCIKVLARLDKDRRWGGPRRRPLLPASFSPPRDSRSPPGTCCRGSDPAPMPPSRKESKCCFGFWGKRQGRRKRAKQTSWSRRRGGES